MSNNIFEPIYDTKGIYGLQSKQCKNGIVKGTKAERQVIMMVWRSPHADIASNEWLEKKLRKIYTKYYLKVLVRSMGFFW